MSSSNRLPIHGRIQLAPPPHAISRPHRTCRGANHALKHQLDRFLWCTLCLKTQQFCIQRPEFLGKLRPGKSHGPIAPRSLGWCERVHDINRLPGISSFVASHRALQSMAHADKRLVGKAGRNTRISRRHWGSSTAASPESSCRFHRCGKLLFPGRDGQGLRIPFAKHVVEQILHVADESRQPGRSRGRAKMGGHACHLELQRRAWEGGEVESRAARRKSVLICLG